jgi:lysine-specific histone demethylase 1
VCVIAVPLGILKASIPQVSNVRDDVCARNGIRFTPPLPDWKTTAISHLGFGLINKVVLRFATKFWENATCMFGHANSAERGEMCMFWASGDAGAYTVTGIQSGRAAEQAEAMADAVLVQRAITILTDIFGSAVPQVCATWVHAHAMDAAGRLGSDTLAQYAIRAGRVQLRRCACNRHHL